MADNRRHNSLVDPALREVQGLDAALVRVSETETAPAEHASADTGASSTTDSAPEPASNRMQIRMLILTTDVTLFVEGSQVQNEYRELAQYADELHIVVLTDTEDALPESLRIAPRAWVYATNSRSPFFSVFDAYRIAKRQLAFAAGFRADTIIATDPFEAGAAGYLVGRAYDRPLQLQLAANPFESYGAAERGSRWRLFAARFIIPRAQCILVRAQYVGDVLRKRYRSIADRIVVLPPFRDLTFFRDATPAFDLHTRYPQFQFIMLAVARLDPRSKVDFIIDACAYTLTQYPTTGLVIVGDGPEQSRLKKRVLAAGLQNKVVFEPESEDLVSHMKTANLLLNAGTTEESSATLAAAAAASLPVLTVGGGIVDTLFEDGVNAFVCPPDDLVCFQSGINEFLNDNQLRTRFAINSREQVFSAIEQDADAYRAQYVQTIESCVLRTFPGQH